jgi:hypothetical protein
MDGSTQTSNPAPNAGPTPLFSNGSSRATRTRRTEPLVGRETAGRKLKDLEQIARRLAATDPYMETDSNDLFCALCDARGRAHRDDCVWLAANEWVHRYLP